MVAAGDGPRSNGDEHDTSHEVTPRKRAPVLPGATPRSFAASADGTSSSVGGLLASPVIHDGGRAPPLPRKLDEVPSSPSRSPTGQGAPMSRSKSQVSLKFHYPTTTAQGPPPAVPAQSNGYDQRSLLSSTNTRSSLATSNSSFSESPSTPYRKTFPSLAADSPAATPRTAARNAKEAQEEQDRTAALINRLYSRLDEHGVDGDGWEEGQERTRDGIINRHSMQASLALGSLMGKSRLSTGTDEVVLGAGGELPAKEERILKRVDRYGFFSESHPAALACQHNRLATLARIPLSTLPPTSPRSRKSVSKTLAPPSLQNRDRSSSVASLLPSLTPEMMALELKRVTKWSEMLSVGARDVGGNTQEWKLASGWWVGRNSSSGGGKYRKFQRRVFKGIPDRWRRAVWGLQMERVAQESTKAGKPAPSLAQLALEYQNLILVESNQDVQIDLDVPRTISGHVLFHTRYGHGQRALFHVLHAFGLHCDGMGGYCQGMGPIAATFLCYFEPERSYACMVRLFDQYNLRHIFEPGFPGLVEAFYVQERLVEQLMPDVHAAFDTHGISSSAYATKWYITLFSNSVPFGTQLRLWDGLLLEGVDFLIVTSIAIIWSFREQFTASNASFESILSALSSYFLVESEDALLRWIRKVMRRTELRRQITGWREEWQGFVKDGSAESRTT